MAKLTGVVYIKIGSQLLQTLPGATLDIGGPVRNPIMGHTLYGHAEQPKPAVVTCTIAHGADTDLLALSATQSATISFECDSGPVYVIANAFCVNPAVLTSGSDSNVSLEFQGLPAEQA